MVAKKRNVTLAEWMPTEDQVDLVNEVLESGRLTYGPMTMKFERMFADLHNRKHAIFTNSGTSALQVVLDYWKTKYGWADGDEVIVPAVTFVASVNVVLQNRLTPVLVDIDPFHFDIDVSKIREKITKRTRAIMPVHLLGQSCRMDAVMEIAEEFDLKVVEDSCETMFVDYKKKPVGSRGDVACFSSYLAHIISTGVGGFITTNDDEEEKIMRSMIWHGRDNLYMTIDANRNPANLEELIHARFRFNYPGYSYRLTEMEAALGVDELVRSEEIISKRQENAEYLTKKLEKFEDRLRLPIVREEAEHAWMFYPLVVEGERDELALHLEENKIQTRWIMPLTNQPVYNGMFDEDEYPVADYINKNGLLIGCHHFLEEEDFDYVAEVIGEYYD